MWDRKEIKETGKIRFKANYWRSVLSAFLLSLLVGGSSAFSGFNISDQNYEQDVDVTVDDNTIDEVTDAFNTIPDEQKAVFGTALLGVAFVAFCIGFILKIFVFNPLQVGCYGFFRENACGVHPDLGVLKTGFGRYGHTFITLFLRDLFLFLWFLLLIVPGCVKLYSYRMVPFILRDNPELSAREVITVSRRLMDGQKWKTFVFDLSYIGWFLLGAITFGIVNIFWTEPYRQNANAALYLSLIGEKGFKPDEEFTPEEVIPLSN